MHWIARWMARVAKRRKRVGSARKTERRLAVEPYEPRRPLSAGPLVLGVVYTEADEGTDVTGDLFEVSFIGGAPGTQLQRLVINGDQIGNFGNQPGFSAADVFFDTVEDPTGLGADHAFPFTIIAITDPHGQPKTDTRVRASVEDGSTVLVLEFENFYAGDKLIFSIDVDEVEVFDPNETDIDIINGGFDPITSGVEMQGTQLVGYFTAPYYYDAEIVTAFINFYDPVRDNLLKGIGASRLDLPADNERQNRDRTAGAFGRVEQQPLPIVIRGRVYHDRDFNLQLDPSAGDHGIEGVRLALYQQTGAGGYEPVLRNGLPVEATTDAEGFYEFGPEWQLLPGVYEIRETQPAGYPISVGAVPGTANGSRTGRAASPDRLTDITIAQGGTIAEGYDFAEARPASLSGAVYYDRNNNGVFESDETGIPEVTVKLSNANGETFTTRTDSAGTFQFVGLPAGTYQIIQVQPAGWIDGLDTLGTVNGVVHGTGGNDRFESIRLLSGDVGTNYWFGETLGSIAGRVFVDEDGDCRFDEHEAPLAGVEIVLRDASGSERIAITDSEGRYQFTELGPGNYTIVQRQPNGYFNGSQRVGTGTGDASVVNEISQVVINEEYQHVDDYDFCEDLASLSGYVYHDRNDDGRRDPQSEEGIPGVVILLWRDAELWGTAVTDENGYYEFAALPPGVYRIEELQPAGWMDGRESVGIVRWPSGSTQASGQSLVNDQIDQVALVPEPDQFGAPRGEQYNFGEWLAASLAGTVFLDLNGNGTLEPDLVVAHSSPRETPLANVTVTLKDAFGQTVATAVTDAQGRYRFESLRPGRYTVEERQPEGLFDGGVRIGTHGGTPQTNRIAQIVLAAGDEAVGYDFYEHPPATISGTVFQDGPPILATHLITPLEVASIRDGVLSNDDTPIAGVWLELRSGLDGRPIDASEALPGYYPPGPIRVQTDAQGRFQFAGLPRGNYAIYEIHPAGYVDSIDTPGTTSGVALNAHEPQPLGLLSRFAGNPPPPNDAILAIAVGYGQHSQANNFSEVRVIGFPKPPDPPVFRYPAPPPMSPLPAVAPPVLFALPPRVVPTSIPIYGASGHVDVTWHLSIINAGFPRGDRPPAALPEPYAWVAHVDMGRVWLQNLQSGKWYLNLGPKKSRSEVVVFGLPGAIPLAGDFNGDRRAELVLYVAGHWFIDLNGNGRWDPDDLWIAFGTENDLPVVGDWDGDGKTDIAIFGPMWAEDPKAIAAEPGLPDVANKSSIKVKNLPPRPEEATDGLRIMQRSSSGQMRADLVDHVFRYGTLGDIPVAGDWNGDGITNIGLFRRGRWILDTNGNGRLDPDDITFTFGQEGDIPLVGNFDGSGTAGIGVYRNGRVIFDSNRNLRMDEADQVLELHGKGVPVVGDFDGDGQDEVVLYESTNLEPPAGEVLQ